MTEPAHRSRRGGAPTALRGVGPRRRARATVRAFTLLELLMVTSLIAILASITLVVGRSVSERSKVAQAKAELAVLAAALEQYKQHYGDYPWTPDVRTAGAPAGTWDGGAILFNALCGNLGPRADKALESKGRTFVDLSRFTLWSNDPDEGLPDDTSTDLRINWFNDPWGQWYYYHYKKGSDDTAWKSRGFLLYSHGPDSLCNVGDAEDTGFLDSLPTDATNLAINRDNIYHGRD